MNIGMMSTWGQHCGVFGYTEQLVDVLNANGHQVIVFGNRPYGKRDLEKPGWSTGYQPNTGTYFDCFGTGFHPKEEQSIDVEKIKYLISDDFLLGKPDVFHIQYQDYLYPDKQGFDKLLSLLKGKGVRLVVTQHDSCISPNIDWGKFDVIIKHGCEFKKNEKNATMPIGIPEIDYKPLSRNKVLSSFGMGRNDNETCKKVCDRLGWTFRFHNSQDKWVPIKELMNWLQEGDVIALIYPPTNAEVSSSALRVALGTGRPIIVSATNWFNDTLLGINCEHRMFGVNWTNREQELEAWLRLIDDNTIDNMDIDDESLQYGLERTQEKYSWKNIVKHYEDVYENTKS